MQMIHADFQGQEMTFRQDGWFNATIAAARFSKEPVQWLRQRETVEYLLALSKHLVNSGPLPEMNKINELNSYLIASRAELLRLSKRTGLVQTKSGPQANGGRKRSVCMQRH